MNNVLQDKYVLTSMTLMVLLCLWHTVVSTIFTKVKNKKLVNRIDYGALAAFFVAYVLFFAVFIAKTKFTVSIGYQYQRRFKICRLFYRYTIL